MKRGEIKIGKVEDQGVGVHFEDEDGNRYAISNAVQAVVEEDRPRPFYPIEEMFGLFEKVRGWRIIVDAIQSNSSLHEENRSYDYEGTAEEIPDDRTLPGSRLQLPAPKN